MMFRLDIQGNRTKLLVAPTDLEIVDFAQAGTNSVLLCYDRQRRSMALCVYRGSSRRPEIEFVPADIDDSAAAAVICGGDRFCCIVGGHLLIWHRDRWREMALSQGVDLGEVCARTPLVSWEWRVAVVAQERSERNLAPGAARSAVVVIDVRSGECTWIRPPESATWRPVDLGIDRHGNLWVLYESQCEEGKTAARLCRFVVGQRDSNVQMLSATLCGVRSGSRALVIAGDDSPILIDAEGVRRLRGSEWVMLANWQTSGRWVTSTTFDAMIDAKECLLVVGEFTGVVSLDLKARALDTMPVVDWLDEVSYLPRE